MNRVTRTTRKPFWMVFASLFAVLVMLVSAGGTLRAQDPDIVDNPVLETTIYLPTIGRGILQSDQCFSHPQGTHPEIRFSNADHHLVADTVHTLPPEIADLLPPDSQEHLVKIAVYGTETVDVNAIDFRKIRVGNGEAKPLSPRVIHDLNRDGYLDLIFVVDSQHLETCATDHFLQVTGYVAELWSAADGDTLAPDDETFIDTSFIASVSLGGAASSMATTIFVAVLRGAARQLGGTAATYALTALGIGGQSNAPVVDLQPVVAELDTISNDITNLGTELDSDLGQIATEIQEQTCQDAFNRIQPDVAQINVWADILSDWAARPGRGIAPPPATCNTPDMENCFETLVDDVISGSSSGSGAVARLASLHDELVPGAGVQGLLESCVKSLAVPAKGSFGDKEYYAGVQDLMMHYYGIQVQALNVYAEARHYKAYIEYVKSNPDPGVENAQLVCQSAPAGSAAETQCDLVVTAVDRLYARLQTQFAIAGAPYTQGNLVKVNNSNYVWSLNLDAFALASGNWGACGDQAAISSQDPCGSVAGTWEDKNFYTDALEQTLQTYGGFPGFAGYNTWEVAGEKAWKELFSLTPKAFGGHIQTQTAAQFLDHNLGLEAQESNRIYLTNDFADLEGFDVVSWVDLKYDPTTWSVSPAQDVGWPPYGTKTPQLLFNGFGTAETRDCVYYAVSVPPGSSTSNLNFYQGFRRAWCEGGTQALWHPLYPPPGFIKRTNTKQLRYPILDISKLSCGAALLCGGARPNANPAGVPSMCGEDFDAYFELKVPKPDGFVDPGC